MTEALFLNQKPKRRRQSKLLIWLSQGLLREPQCFLKDSARVAIILKINSQRRKMKEKLSKVIQMQLNNSKNNSNSNSINNSSNSSSSRFSMLHQWIRHPLKRIKRKRSLKLKLWQKPLYWLWKQLGNKIPIVFKLLKQRWKLLKKLQDKWTIKKWNRLERLPGSLAVEPWKECLAH